MCIIIIIIMVVILTDEMTRPAHFILKCRPYIFIFFLPFLPFLLICSICVFEMLFTPWGKKTTWAVFSDVLSVRRLLWKETSQGNIRERMYGLLAYSP